MTDQEKMVSASMTSIYRDGFRVAVKFAVDAPALEAG
jgi:hypothetical protein